MPVIPRSTFDIKVSLYSRIQKVNKIKVKKKNDKKKKQQKNEKTMNKMKGLNKKQQTCVTKCYTRKRENLLEAEQGVE